MNKKILVVDDSKLNGNLLKAYLGEYDLESIHAFNGQAALEVLAIIAYNQPISEFCEYNIHLASFVVVTLYRIIKSPEVLIKYLAFL